MENENETFAPATLQEKQTGINTDKWNTGRKKPGKQTPSKSVLICVLITSLVIAAASGVTGYYIRDAQKTRVVYQPQYVYREAKGFEQFDLLTKTMALADSDFYEDVDYDAMDKALSVAFVESLDDFSSMSATGGGSASVNVGIGITMHISQYNEYYVEHVYAGSAADGVLMRGDKLLAVTNDSNPLLINYRMDCLDYAYLPSCFAGPEGTKLILRILRDGVEKDVLIVKAPYTVERAYYIDNLGGSIPDDIGYIKLSTFTDTAASDFEKCVDAFNSDGYGALILDLRNNTGGSTGIMGQIGSYLISDGQGTKQTPIIKFGNDASLTYYTEDSSKFINKPIYVLTNSSTASAAEALLSAMKYYGTATATLGTTTYGKGIGQSSRNLVDDDDVGYNVSLTTGKYFTFVEPDEEYPDGLKCIHGIGLTPDYQFMSAIVNEYNTELCNDKLIQKVAEIVGGAE